MYCLQWLIPVLLIPKPLNPEMLQTHVMFMVLHLAGFFLERKPCSICSLMFLVTVFVICYSGIGAVGPAISVVIVSYAGCDQVLVVSIITVGLGLMGFCFPSLKVNTIDLSPNYSATIMALANGGGCLSGMFAPYTVGVLTPNRTIEEWRVAFWIMAAMLSLSNCVFLLFGSAEVQYWNDMDEYRAKLRQETERTEMYSDC